MSSQTLRSSVCVCVCVCQMQNINPQLPLPDVTYYNTQTSLFTCESLYICYIDFLSAFFFCLCETVALIKSNASLNRNKPVSQFSTRKRERVGGNLKAHCLPVISHLFLLKATTQRPCIRWKTSIHFCVFLTLQATLLSSCLLYRQTQLRKRLCRE